MLASRSATLDVSFALLTCCLTTPALAGDDSTQACAEVVARVVRLLPERPPKIVVIDPDKTPALRARLAHVEAFVTHGERVVYLRKQGRTLRQAMRMGGFFDFALAAIIWHEMAHIGGADEIAAQRAEQALWRQYIVQRRVDSAAGLEYLWRLTKREEAQSDR